MCRLEIMSSSQGRIPLPKRVWVTFFGQHQCFRRPMAKGLGPDEECEVFYYYSYLLIHLEQETWLGRWRVPE